MKIRSTKIGYGLKAPFTAQVFQLIGGLQFVGASWFAFAGTALLKEYIGPNGVVFGLIIAVSLGISASVSSFAIARVIQDIYAIRWHTSEYKAEHSEEEREEMRLLRQSLDRLSRNLEAMNGTAAPDESVEAPEPAPLPEPEAAPEDHDPFDDFDEAEPESAAEGRKSAFAFTVKDMRFFYAIAGVLIVAIIILVIAIFRR